MSPLKAEALVEKEQRTPQKGSGGAPLPTGTAPREETELGTDGGVPSSEGGGQSQRCWPCRQTCLPHLWTRTSNVGHRDSMSSRLHARGPLGPGPTALPMHEYARCPWSRASADPNVGQQGDPACRRGLCPSEERGTCDHMSVQQCLTHEPLVTISRTNPPFTWGGLSQEPLPFQSANSETTLYCKLHPNVKTETLRPG